jgi:predicted DNA-binding protein (UPF0278 family)
MPNVTVELDWETVDNIVLSQLQDAYSGLVTDLEERQNESRRGGIFDTDKDTDIILIKKHLDAFKLAIKYFGGKVEE